MLLHRIYPHLEGARSGQPGHPMYVHRPQGANRLDNRDLYDVVYFGLTPETAVGETFADITHWREEMLPLPVLPDSRRALGLYEIEDDVPLLDLDDANALRERCLRPTQVISRNRPATQAWARSIYQETSPGGARCWAGVRWWSFHRPHWVVIALWTPHGETPVYSHVRTEPLSMSHPAVIDAARSLGKVL